jgi:DNA-binding GntR family transcriptional regulator
LRGTSPTRSKRSRRRRLRLGRPRFHHALVESAGNQLLTRQYAGLRDRHQRIAAPRRRRPRPDRRFIAEHREIVAALEAGDGDRAAELLGTHLQGAHELARRPR